MQREGLQKVTFGGMGSPALVSDTGLAPGHSLLLCWVQGRGTRVELAEALHA